MADSSSGSFSGTGGSDPTTNLPQDFGTAGLGIGLGITFFIAITFALVLFYLYRKHLGLILTITKQTSKKSRARTSGTSTPRSRSKKTLGTSGTTNTLTIVDRSIGGGGNTIGGSTYVSLHLNPNASSNGHLSSSAQTSPVAHSTLFNENGTSQNGQNSSYIHLYQNSSQLPASFAPLTVTSPSSLSSTNASSSSSFSSPQRPTSIVIPPHLVSVITGPVSPTDETSSNIHRPILSGSTHLSSHSTTFNHAPLHPSSSSSLINAYPQQNDNSSMIDGESVTSSAMELKRYQHDAESRRPTETQTTNYHSYQHSSIMGANNNGSSENMRSSTSERPLHLQPNQHHHNNYETDALSQSTFTAVAEEAELESEQIPLSSTAIQMTDIGMQIDR